jgi:hypothetical protein
MGLTKFPHGVSSFGMPMIGAGPLLTTGNVFFVDSGSANAVDDTAHGKDPVKPFATWDYAIGRCTASNGDIIFLMPGHDENPTASITMDVAGVRVHGLGWGATKPTVTFGAAGATLAMSAANCVVENVRFDLGTVAATVTNAINITADGCQVHGCETVPHATSQFTNHLTATDAQFVVIADCDFKSIETASSTSGVVVDGCDDLVLVRTRVYGHFTEHALDNTTPASADEILRAYIADCTIQNYSTTAGDLAVELDDAATGTFARNMIVGGLATTAANYNIGNMAPMESYVADTNGIDVHGIVLGTAAV